MISIFGFYVLPVKIRPYALILLNAYFCCAFGWKHFAVLAAGTLFSYAAGKIIQKTKSKAVLGFSISAIVLSLFFVKFGSVFGITSVFVPIGYSFYALQMISFLCDLKKEKISSFTWIEYVCYMTFFPILLQGPICRFESMKKQFHCETAFNVKVIQSGLFLMLFGIFKKVVIADRLGVFVSDVFTSYQDKSGAVILTAVVFYAFQLYSDFSGCTDISRGVSECLGIELPANFNAPYTSLSIKEFWNRWHLSLSSWLKDYVYIPLGGNRKGKLRQRLNLFVTFFVSGLWHGTGLQYILWGLLQAFGQMAEGLMEQWFSWLKQTEKPLVKLVRWLYVSLFTLGSWLLFRAHGVRAALIMLYKILTDCFNTTGIYECGLDQKDMMAAAVLILGLMMIDLIRRKKPDIRKRLMQMNYWCIVLMMMVLMYGIMIFGFYGSGFDASGFIYMEF